jgi:hypothetical protein
MKPTAQSPFVGARTFVFRRYLTLRYQLTSATSVAAKAAHRARKLHKKEVKDELLRNFFGWCEGCMAYSSIF